MLSRETLAPAGSRDFQCKAFVWRDFHMTCFKGLKGSHHTDENKLKVNLKWKLNKHFAHLLSKETIVAV